MNTLLTLLLAVQMITALAMIGLILLQHGKGADMGAAFGGGSSGSLFGATGSANFLSRTTAVLAAVFFACTLLLAYFGNARPAGTEGSSVLERVGLPAPVSSAPAAPASAAPVSGAGAIPAGAPAAPAAVPAPAATPASGAAQIPAQ